MEILNGVLNGNHVSVAGGVHGVHNTGQGGGLAAAGRTGKQDHAPCTPGECHDVVRNAQGYPIGQRKGDHPNYKPEGTALLESVDPKAGQAGDSKGEVVVPAVGQAGEIPISRHAVESLGEGGGICRQQARPFPADDAVDLIGNRKSGNDQNIGGPTGHRIGQNVHQFHGYSSLSLPPQTGSVSSISSVSSAATVCQERISTEPSSFRMR